MTAQYQTKILIVDDEPVLRRVLSRALRPHIITTADNGAQALDILQRSPPFDLILCDLSMPGLSGDQVFKHAITQDPSLKQRFVIITGGAMTPPQKSFLRDVQPRLLKKPFTPAQLRALIPAPIETHG